MFSANSLLARILLILGFVAGLYGDTAPLSSQGSSGIVDFYFTSSTSGIEVPKVYVDVAKIQTEVNSVKTFFPRTKQIYSCVGDNADICQKDAARCDAVEEDPLCPSGGALNTIRDMCQADPTYVCGTGYTFDPSIDRCVKDVVCPSGGTFNATTDRCEKVIAESCPDSYTLDSASGICWKAVDCGIDGVFNPTKDRCEKPLSANCSDPAYVYNPVTYRCEKAPSCSIGTYSAAYDKCMIDYTSKCDAANGYTLNTTTNRCEKAPPACPTGSNYNNSTNRCEGVVSACVSPAVWNSTTQKCETTSTYAATASTGSLIWDNCEGGPRLKNDGDLYCAAKGMRLPTINESKAKGGSVPSCANGYKGWTWSSSTYKAGAWWAWSDTNTMDGLHIQRCGDGGCGYMDSGDAIGIRCVKNTTTYTCPNGGTLSGTTCTLKTSAAGSCAAGLTPDPTTGACVVGSTCPITAGYGAAEYDSSSPVRDICYAPIYKDCSAYSGFTYDSGSNKCVSAPDCTSGALDTATDKCYQSACPSGYTFNSTSKVCEASPICSNGTYNTTYNKCLLAFTPGCDSANSYTYSSANSQCERTPQCQSGSSYNAATNRCEGGSSCTSPAVWNSTTQKCDLASSYTYTATAAGGMWQRGDGSDITSNTNVDSWYMQSGRYQHFNDQFSGSACIVYTSPIMGVSPYKENGNYSYSVGQTRSISTTSNTLVKETFTCINRYDCPSGGTLSGTTCTVNTINSTSGVCAADFTPDPTTGICVASSPTCPASAGWSATMDYPHDVCRTDYTKDCLVGGMTYDSASNMCAKDASCTGTGKVNTNSDKCELTLADCGTWATDSANNVCYSDATCLNGAFSGTNNRCEASVVKSCDLEYQVDDTATKCISQISCPSDPNFSENASIAYSSALDKCVSNTEHHCTTGYTYNGLPILKCEAVPVCTGGVYNPANDRCYNNLVCPIGNFQCIPTKGGTEHWCSPYTCLDAQCGIASCQDEQSATLGATDSNKCSSITCDINSPYNEYCGVNSCPTGYGVYSSNGKCYQDVCPAGSTQQSDGSCQTLQCPSGSTETNGICITN